MKSVQVLALILLVAGGFFLYSKGMIPFQLPIGWTTLSLSQVTFTTTAPGGLPSPVWVMTVAQGGLAQSAQGYIDKEKVGQMSGTKPQYDLEITMNWNKLSWEYPIRVSYTSQPVKTYQLVEWDDWRLICYEQDAISHCGSDYAYFGKFPWSATCFCIREVQETSFMGYLDNCNVHSVSTINMKAAGQPYSATIDTKEQISQNVGPYAYVVWNGNLMKQNCPTQSPYLPFYKGGWKLGDQNYYRDYNQYYNDFIQYVSSAQVGGNWDRATLETKISYVNSYASRFISNIKQFGEIINSVSTDKAYVDMSLTSDVQVPVYTFYVSAAWLGIYQPAPKPQIVEVRGADFKSGEYGFLYVKWNNVGDSGNFEVWAECTSPVNTLETTKTIGVSTGGSSETYIKVGGNVGSRTCQACVIKVKGAGTNNVDSRSVQVCIDPQKVCTPGVKECSYDLKFIRQCNSEGSGWNTIKTCLAGEYCTYVSGEPACTKEITCDTDADCNDNNPCTKDTCVYDSMKGRKVCKNDPIPGCGGFDITIIFGLIAGALAFFGTGGIRNLKDEEYDALAISAIFAIIAGLIAWYVVSNWQTILLALGIATILGGIGLYFLGGAILFIIFILMQIIRTIKGE